MRGTFLTQISRLRSDERGTSALELAFTAPIFLLLLVGLGDLARGVSQKFALQQAVNRTIELAQYGSPSDDYAYLEAKLDEAATAAGATGAVSTFEAWLECNGVDTAKLAWSGSCPAGQQIARYVSLTLDSTFVPMFGSAGYPGANANGSIPLRARASLRVQ